MIKVVHIITGLDTGGAEMMLYKFLSTSDRTKFKSIVISLKDKGTFGSRIEELGIPVYIIGMTDGKATITALWKLSNLIRSISPDIIQGWMYHGNIAASISRLLYYKKVSVIWNIRHSLYALENEKKQTALLIRLGAICNKLAEKTIYNSRKSADQHENLGYAVDRTVVIPNGFDCDKFKPSKTVRKQMRNILNIKNRDIVFGLIGRYHPMKDHANFFKAAGRLSKTYSNVIFLLAGRDVDDSNVDLIELIMRYDLENCVYLLGERNDIYELNTCLDIACSSSSYGEAFPNVIGEAMSCAVPCVVTDVGDSAWIVGDTGKVVPPRDADEFANACDLLIKAGREERKRLGEMARKRVIDNFALDKIVREYEALYEGKFTS